MQFQIMLDNFTKLICIKYKDGDIINFYWSGNKLEKIVNSDNEEVHLTYNSINFLVKVDFISQHRFIQFDYFTQENKIMMTTYAYEENSTSTTKLKEIEINYQSNYLSKVIDKISSFGRVLLGRSVGAAVGCEDQSALLGCRDSECRGRGGRREAFHAGILGQLQPLDHRFGQ